MKTNRMPFFLLAVLAFPLCGRAQVVIDSNSDPYTLSPDTVSAGKPFVLHATSQRFNCNMRFFNQAIRETGDSLYLYFDDTTTSTLAPCADLPVGPTFDMTTLKSGKYLVFMSQLFYCPVGNVCSALAILAPQLAGTLYVVGSSALRTASAPPDFAASLRGGVLTLSLPLAPAAPWTVEIASLSGRILQSFRVEPQAGAEVRLPLSARLDNGLYFVRLVVPGQVLSTLRALGNE